MPFHAPSGDWGLGWQNRQANPAVFPAPGADVPPAGTAPRFPPSSRQGDGIREAIPAAAGFQIS